MLVEPRFFLGSFTLVWEQRKLGEFGKATGGTSIESEFDELGKYKVISIGSYSETSKYTDQGIRVNKTNKTESRILKKNNLTMILNDKTASGNIIGRVLLIDADDSYVFNQRTERIDVYENEYLPDFLYQLLNADNIREKIIRASQGNTQIYVNWASISELFYKIPVSKSEQRKIADLFNQLDNLITLHQRKYDKLVNVKKSMLEKMFPRDGKNVPEIRFAGFTEAWEQRKLGELSSSFEYGLNVAAKSYDGINKYIRITDIDDETRTFLDSDLTSPDCDLALSENYLLQDGDIVFARTGASVGKTFIYKASDGIVYYAGFLIRARLKENVFPQFVFYNTLTKEYERFIRITSQRSGQPGVNAQEYATFELFLPKYEEQYEIGKFLCNLDHLITLHQRELEKLKNIKKSCLEKMFV